MVAAHLVYMADRKINIAEARKWYTRAVELGAPDAAHKLATLGGN